MLGNKISLHLSTDGGTQFSGKIADVIDIQVGEKTAETVESHTYASDHNYKEYDYGLKDGGEYTIAVRYKAGQTEVDKLEKAYDADEKVHVQLQFPAPIQKSVTFEALITKVGHTSTREAHVDRSFGLKVSGEPKKATLSAPKAAAAPSKK